MNERKTSLCLASEVTPRQIVQLNRDGWDTQLFKGELNGKTESLFRAVYTGENFDYL